MAGELIGSRYRIKRQVGEGGMATVFLAEDLKHHRPVAVKVLLESLTYTIGIRRFLQEIEGGRPRPEVDPVNYVPRIRVPTLMLNGRHDVVHAYETSQVPFFQQLGTAPSDKKHITYPSGHSVPQGAVVRESLAWFDRYLSGAVVKP